MLRNYRVLTYNAPVFFFLQASCNFQAFNRNSACEKMRFLISRSVKFLLRTVLLMWNRCGLRFPTYHSWMLLRGETATQHFTAGQHDQTKPYYICILHRVRSCFVIIEFLLTYSPIEKQTYPASIVNDAEIGFVLQLPWFLELAVGSLLLHQFVHKSFIGGFWKPALFIQQSQHTRRIGLKKEII